MPLEWVRRRVNNKALWRSDAVWRNVLQTPKPHSSKREPNLRTDEADASVMGRAGVICEASHKPTKGRVAHFTVVEGKPSGLRRRFVAWPKGENDRNDREAEAPLRHVSRYLGAMFGEVATVFDLKAPFFRVSLPQSSRTSFRCRAERGMLVEPTRLPMGRKCGPEVLHTVARVLAGDAAVVGSRYAAPKSLTIHVWVDNIRISGRSRT
ncbi:hypothetical protein ERJ75_000405400 [Trypanosoma vivax]|uniref:Uncharacterized protein n=1 Tax=Trypanosoma vivax (strain Y486) TaxID=1055687 RepID=F9WVV8_TRYVY|nr:hypothetical protein ERJ75_000860700 [Trypanosoma vivax]KAH8617079.1 hypothetical protein ERJ75_000411100 [Trypanosoma vivax]KAH8617179.1 hypothetical protein ERJ75_000405400 [Trypanosoma vivax]CCD21720.1 hypothetical protein, conserved in T. vivax [Trypanosoma vivax Y486]|eukprot:CCD21720.1 hypothetical protein, conserved in T. vivax [Trypanosoma vivax Y486]